ncbi:MAG: sulfotransferase domain-containing protein [Alphaproteobacteria bacterium]|nr:sulfotransferase domain-containing protein [Alphaproteobacteria bacterium]
MLFIKEQAGTSPANSSPPNFLIVGAAKSGTTSLYHYLRTHPDVFLPDWKEPAFFAPPEAGGARTAEEYLKLFEGARGKKAIGEASVAHLYAADAPGKIHEFLSPAVKIVILLRNPVDMAYSNWGHQVREGYETLSFEEALAQEDRRRTDPAFLKSLKTWIGDVLYRDRASYPAQIARYDSVFAPENIKIFIYEEFFAPGLPLWGELCDFLGIARTPAPERRVHNRAGSVRSRLVQSVLRERSGWKDALKKIIPERPRRWIKARMERLNRTRANLAPLAPETRARLETIFAADVAWMEKRLNRPLKDLWFDHGQG